MMSLLFTGKGVKDREKKSLHWEGVVKKSGDIIYGWPLGPYVFNWRILLFCCHRIVQLQLFTLDKYLLACFQFHGTCTSGCQFDNYVFQSDLNFGQFEGQGRIL